MRSGRYQTLIAFVLALIALILSARLVYAISGNWSRNGCNMSGEHKHSWIEPHDLKIEGRSSARTPRGVMQNIYVDVRAEDRCRNPDGTWQPWHMYAYKNKNVTWSYGTGWISAQGRYQDCWYGHDYRNKSLHDFYDEGFGIDESQWLTSYP